MKQIYDQITAGNNQGSHQKSVDFMLQITRNITRISQKSTKCNIKSNLKISGIRKSKYRNSAAKVTRSAFEKLVVSVKLRTFWIIGLRLLAKITIGKHFRN